MNAPNSVPLPSQFPTTEPTIKGVPDVYPILAAEFGRTLEQSNLAGVVGTGFRLGPDVLVTCWHCVENENYAYFLTRGEEEGGGAVVYPLTQVAQDANGTDLATAKIDDDLTTGVALRLRLSNVAAPAARNVWTFGYPLPTSVRHDDGKQRVEVTLASCVAT